MNNRDRVTWVARYKDSTHVQYNADGEYQDRYADIVRDKLEYFELWLESNPKQLLVRYHFDTPNKRLIWRRRVYKRNDGSELVIYLVGWQMKVGGENVQSLSVIFPDNHIEVIDRWQENEIFHKPVPHPHEGEDWS